MPPADPEAFIARWSLADASELSTAQSFLNDLIALIGADRPDPSHAHGYSFEIPVRFPSSAAPGRIDLYKRRHLVLDAKRGAAPAPSSCSSPPHPPRAAPPARPGTSLD